MVSSTAIPRAIENVIAVDGLNFIPEKPIIAAAATSGIIVGRIEIKDRRTERNNITIEMKIIIKANIKLVVKSLIKNPCVLRASSVLPDIRTS